MKDFKFLKKYGQNFLSDKNLLNAIVTDGEVDERTTVLEVGPGAGALTRAILSKCKKLVSVEIDDRLIPELQGEFGSCDKFTLINKDFMKLSDSEIKELVGEDYRVVANIPYYISTSLIMRFLEGEIKPKSVTVMVQKEVAERLTAKAGVDSYGVISVAVALRGKAKITRNVNRKMFFPVPDVDSAVVHITLDENVNPEVEKVMKLVRQAFAMRRKTLRNNLVKGMGVDGEKFDKAITKMGLDVAVRGEKLTPEQFVELYNLLK